MSSVRPYRWLGCGEMQVRSVVMLAACFVATSGLFAALLDEIGPGSPDLLPRDVSDFS